MDGESADDSPRKSSSKCPSKVDTVGAKETIVNNAPPPFAIATIRGQGKDQDGPFTITTGKLSPFTGKCYWVEESAGPNKRNSQRTQVLVVEAFTRDEELGCVAFKGDWISNFGTRGSYARFGGFPKNNNNFKKNKTHAQALQETA